MPSSFGSPPFNISPEEQNRLTWGFVRAIIGAVLVAAGAFFGSELLPELAKHVNNHVGDLIVALLAAGVPVFLSWAQKFFPDTRKPLLGLLALTLVLAGSGSVMAAESTGLLDNLLPNLTKDPTMLAIVLLGAALFASKVLKIDLSAWVVPLINSLLKPPTPTPTTPITPTVPIVTDPTMPLVQLLVNLLNQSKVAGDKEAEDATIVVMNRLTKK